MDHQHNRRRAGDAVAGGALQNHPPPQPCPRCNSNNTKFCYFNNYSLSQPRFFCKGCRRYWTQGGTLRNVPVGGGCRKSKRPKLTAAAATTTSVSALPLVPPSLPSQQLIMNAHDHQLSSFGGTTTTNNNNASGVTNNTSTGMMMGQHLFATGSSSSGFLSSLPLNFGTNMGLLQGFGGLQNFEQQRQRILQQLQQQQQQEQHQQQQRQQQQQNPVQGSLQGVCPIREVGGPSAASAQEWSLGMQPGPSAASETDNSSNTTTTTTNNNISQVHQWPDFMGTSGLDDE